MFARNLWYVAGWDTDLPPGKLLPRRIINEPVLLYRKGDGSLVAIEDRCCHRAAALHLGALEGDCVRCMYHGLKFAADGRCVEIPGQDLIPPQARVRAYPTAERNNWMWVWMGDPVLADPDLIPRGWGPGEPGWHLQTGELHFAADYRLIFDNLLDFSHLTYVHRKTFGGTDEHATSRPKITRTDRSIHVERWLRGAPPMPFVAHLFPQGTKLDMVFSYEVFLPCTFIMRFDVHAAGTATEGPSDGALILASRTAQGITPESADSAKYYFSWGASHETDAPGLVDMMVEAAYRAFNEDKEMIEAQHRNLVLNPQGSMLSIGHDAALGQMRWMLERMIKAEAEERAA